MALYVIIICQSFQFNNQSFEHFMEANSGPIPSRNLLLRVHDHYYNDYYYSLHMHGAILNHKRAFPGVCCTVLIRKHCFTYIIRIIFLSLIIITVSTRKYGTMEKAIIYNVMRKLWSVVICMHAWCDPENVGIHEAVHDSYWASRSDVPLWCTRSWSLHPLVFNYIFISICI